MAGSVILNSGNRRLLNVRAPGNSLLGASLISFSRGCSKRLIVCDCRRKWVDLRRGRAVSKCRPPGAMVNHLPGTPPPKIPMRAHVPSKAQIRVCVWYAIAPSCPFAALVNTLDSARSPSVYLPSVDFRICNKICLYKIPMDAKQQN